MTPSLAIVAAIGVLCTTGIYLLLSRSLSRALFGLLMLGNGVNLMFLVAGGRAGSPPIVGVGVGRSADPLPQALVLTAVVITLGTTAFVLAIAQRVAQLAHEDTLDDDPEDVRITALSRLERAEDRRGEDALPTFDDLTRTHDEDNPDDPVDDPAGGPAAGAAASTATALDAGDRREIGGHR